MKLNNVGITALDVWDTLIAAITQAGSIGELLDDYKLQFTYYSYSGALAAGATYVPAQKTIVMMVHMTPYTGTDHHIVFTNTPLAINPANVYGFHGAFMCDGTNVGLRNNDGAGKTLTLYGVSMA